MGNSDRKDFDAEMLKVEYIRAAFGKREIVAGVQPRCGGNLVSLSVDGREYIYYDEEALHDPEPMYTGCFIMFPTPCRVPDGTYQFEGRTIVQNKAGRLEAIHGLVRDESLEFAVAGGSMKLELDITPEHPVHEGFPFPGLLTMNLDLVESGLEYSFCFENRGSSPAPVGFGLHPFWRLPEARKDAYVTVPCEETMVLKDLIPTGETESVEGTELDFRQARCLEGVTMDNVFLSRVGTEPAVIEYRDAGTRLTLHADEIFSHQIVYAPAGESFVCVENLTCAPNAVNLQSCSREVSGFRVVGAGEKFSGTTRFYVEDM